MFVVSSQEFAEVHPKNWNFPKAHLGDHGYDDIEDKGVAANFNTKPWEKRHGPAKTNYGGSCNFKDYARQVCILHLFTPFSDYVLHLALEP